MKTKEEIKNEMIEAIGSYNNPLTESIAESCAEIALKYIPSEDIPVNEAIKLARAKKGLTQSELASFARVSKQAISLIEKGHSIPDTSTIKGISRVLKMDFKNLLLTCHPDKWAETEAKEYLLAKRKTLKNYDQIVFDVINEYLIYMVKKTKVKS